MELNFGDNVKNDKNFASSADNITLLDSFEDYLDRLDSFLKFDSPDKWFNISKDNSCEKISIDAALENPIYTFPESRTNNISSDASDNDTDCFSETSDGSFWTVNKCVDIGTNDQNLECKKLPSGSRKRRLTCDEFVSHLKHTRESIYVSSKSKYDDKLDEVSYDADTTKQTTNNNVIDKLERKRLNILGEILATEETYLHHLHLCVDLFMQPVQKLNLLPDKVITTIFCNIQLIMALNKELHSHLSTKSVGEAFIQLAPYLKLYSTYAQNHERALANLLEWDQRSPDFSKFRRQQEEDPDMKGLKLNALLITPVQRVPRYKLLLEELLQCTSNNHEDYKALENASKEVASVANHINEHIRQQDNFMKMFEIQKSLSRSSGSRILVPGRTFIKEGTLKKVSNDGKKYHERIFFLFSDILIYAKPRLLDPAASSGQYNSLRCCCTFPLHYCTVDRVLGDGQGQGSLFSIKCKNEFLLLFSDKNTVNDWIHILKKQIDEVKLNRQTLRKKSSAFQPLRQEKFLSLFKRKGTPQNTPEKNSKIKLTPKSITPINSPRSGKLNKDSQVTPSRGFGPGLACIRKSRKKMFAEVPVIDKPKVFKDFTILEESNIFAGHNITLNDSLENILACNPTRQKEAARCVVVPILESDEYSTAKEFHDSVTSQNPESCSSIDRAIDVISSDGFTSPLCMTPPNVKSLNFSSHHFLNCDGLDIKSSPHIHVTTRKTPRSKV